MSATVAKKMLEASKKIGHIEKDGFNAHFKFKFQAWDDVLPSVRDACAEVGLWIMPSVTEIINFNGDLSIIKMVVTFMDTESGESISVDWIGEGKDGQDKGIQKAVTSAMKYCLLKSLMIPCADTVDPDEAAPAPKQPKPQVQKPALDDAAKEQMAVDFVKTLGEVLQGDLQTFKDSCSAKGYRWFTIALQAKASNVTTMEDLQLFIEGKEKK